MGYVYIGVSGEYVSTYVYDTVHCTAPQSIRLSINKGLEGCMHAHINTPTLAHMCGALSCQSYTKGLALGSERCVDEVVKTVT